MSQFYFRTEAEFIEDDMLCSTECQHRDCAATRVELTESCRYCGDPVAGRACMFEENKLVHAVCVMQSVE